MNETDGDCAVCMAACRLSCGAPVKPAGDFMSLDCFKESSPDSLCFILNLFMHPAVFFIVVIVIYKQLMQQLTLCNLTNMDQLFVYAHLCFYTSNIFHLKWKLIQYLWMPFCRCFPNLEKHHHFIAFYRFHLSPLGLQNPKSKPEIYSLVFIISDFGWSCHASCGHHRLPLVVFPQVVGIILL